MREPLDKALRQTLENIVIRARDTAETAVLESLHRLGVAESQAPAYLKPEERTLRNQLRAHARQLGDALNDGEQEISRLVNEVAYEHWHRMLFARFLEQNNLLMYDGHTPVTLEECGELAEEEPDCNDGWDLAARLAEKMLPQIFRPDSPAFKIKLSLNHTRTLESLLANLPTQTFQAQDSLGWCYQFWQSKKKQQVNESGVKIGAQELSPVTQLFTEPYMVSFLLDNALGAWWTNKRLTQDDLIRANNEQELRDKAAIPGVPLHYLRFVKDETKQQWTPAAGVFEQWPDQLSELKTIDPCCGSGHFLVAVFLMLVPMRMQAEHLTAKNAIDKVLRENLFGLELDKRCVELAAFALALEAWRYPEAGGYRPLPELHLACSGLSIEAAKDEWKVIGKKAGKQNLTIALDWMHETFNDAPVLGSLINPRRSQAAQIAQWDELQQLVGEVLSQEKTDTSEGEGNAHNNRLEASIVTQGLAKAAELLAGQYSWVVTNVPYLARGKQNDTLKDFCGTYYPEGKNDLATTFLDRCLEFCVQGGTNSIVLPQNWLFQPTYQRFREKLLRRDSWHLIASLGAGAFDTVSGEVVKAILINLSCDNNVASQTELLQSFQTNSPIRGLDVSAVRSTTEKAAALINGEIKTVEQRKQLENPGSLVTFENIGDQTLGLYGKCIQGIKTGDDGKIRRCYWEVVPNKETWVYYQSTFDTNCHFGGLEYFLYWKDQGEGLARRQGNRAWGKQGIAVSQMSSLPAALYIGEKYDSNMTAIVPFKELHASALVAYALSGNLSEEVRKIDSALKPANSSFEKIPFDLGYWTEVAEEQYPNGLPEPYTNDPTQWIFHGHPCGSVIWDNDTKWTAEYELRTDESVLHVTVARLLGYQWPAELDQDMKLAKEQRAWVDRCKDLADLIDDDGIVCLPAVRGEKSAVKRLEALLHKAYGAAWNSSIETQLLQAAKAKDLESWLRDKFFEQHCKIFQHRPFIWQIWDGLKDGFSALVNYHTLDYKGLERLIYTYLSDWISNQKRDLAEGKDGADIRLTAAENLKTQLEAILQGEKGLDIFVRWKPMEEQPIGWNPDLNDGVRLNIRPFMLAKDVGKTGAGVLRSKPNIKWNKDRGTDTPSAPWYHLGPEYGGKEGDRINEHHLSLAEKRVSRETDES